MPSANTPTASRPRPSAFPPASPLELAALAGFAVSQPLFDVLARGATFFVAHRAGPLDVVAFALAIALLPALAALALGGLARAIAWRFPRAGRGLHLACFALLSAAVALPVLRRLFDAEAPWTALAAAAAGGLAAGLRARWEAVRAFLVLLSPAALVFAALFVMRPAVRRLAFPGASAAVGDAAGVQARAVASAVFVVFDELPLGSLLTPEGAIDARLFPNFARLASRSTWMRNATASHESTEIALPAIMTGLLPADSGLLPTWVDHPKSVFTMLASSLRLRVFETFTDVCPPRLAQRGEGDGTAPEDPGGDAGGDAGGGAGAGLLRALLADAAVVWGHVVLPGAWARAALPAIDNQWGGFAPFAPFAPGADPKLAESESNRPMSGGPDRDSDPESASESPSQAAPGSAEDDLAAKQAAGRSDRLEQVRAFIRAIDGDAEPTLYFLHVLLPHGPFVYAPSGARYDPSGLPSGFAEGRLPEEQAVADQQQLRHLLQLGCVDALLGELLDRLESSGLFERCALVLLADHGINFAPGEFTRQAFKKNAVEIAHVPFFVRRPGQTLGGVDDRNVQTVDALPTLLDALGLSSPWPLDGRSALDDPAPPERAKKLYRRARPPLELEDGLPSEWRSVEQKTRQFGAAPTWSDVFASGPRPDLIGRTWADLAPLPSATLRARLDRPGASWRVAPGASELPLVVNGWVEGPAADRACAAVAVAVDGVVRAVVAPIERAAGRARFNAFVDERAWTPGEHEVETAVVLPSGEVQRLR